MKKIIITFYIFLLVITNAVFSNENTLAILPFKNSSTNPEYTKIASGIPEMLMTDISQSNKISLVERLQILKAIDHFKFEQTGFIDDQTAIQIGKWLGAKYLLLGNFSAINNAIRIDCRIIETEDGVLINSAKSSGNSEDIFKMVDDLAQKIINSFTGELINVSKVICDNEFRITPSQVFYYYFRY